MDKYEVEATTNTPYILLDPKTASLLMEGVSWPENAMDVFNPLFEKLDEYLEKGTQELRVDIKLEYHNTSSQKMMRELISRLQQAQKAGHKITLNLYYLDGDTDMMEDWEDLMFDLDMEYQILEQSD